MIKVQELYPTKPVPTQIKKLFIYFLENLMIKMLRIQNILKCMAEKYMSSQ